jgi:phosphoglycolate phosphatase-like HAD superfamily hydrolase
LTLMDDGYQRFIELVKRLVHLEVLLRVVEQDQRHFSSLKMRDAWHSLGDKVIDAIVRDMTQIRKELRQMDGKILQVKQEVKGEDHVDPARDGAREFLAKLAEQYKVIIFTTQPVAKVWGWLKEYDMDGYVAEVTDRKPPALFYVDDRAVTFRGGYSETLEEIKRFRPHWKG